MTDRWSNPSGGLGIDRFRVWPAGSDSYSHSDLAGNWDTLDGLIGVPSSGNWPPTTGIDGGIYNEVKILKADRVPIGTIIPWFRATDASAIPTTWHVCDGTTLSSGSHNFPGIAGSVTLPDLRNRFILGADSTLSIGTAAAAVGSATIDTASGAPGPQTVGGSNQIIQTVAQLAAHGHTFTGNALANHGHSFSGNALGPHNHFSVFFDNTQVHAAGDLQGGGGRTVLVDFGGFTGATDYFVSADPRTSSDSAGTPTGSISSASAGTPSGTNSTTGSGSPMDNRPHWVGLIYLCKVLYST